MLKRRHSVAQQVKLICTLIIPLFICYTYVSAQQTLADYLSFGIVLYDPADSTQHIPVIIQDLIPDFPVHDNIYFRCVCVNNGREIASDCMSECCSDKLGKCFRVFMQYPKFRSAFAIIDCYYYYNGEKSYMPDLYLIMDDKFRLRVWKR